MLSTSKENKENQRKNSNNFLNLFHTESFFVQTIEKEEERNKKKEIEKKINNIIKNNCLSEKSKNVEKNENKGKPEKIDKTEINKINEIKHLLEVYEKMDLNLTASEELEEIYKKLIKIFKKFDNKSDNTLILSENFSELINGSSDFINDSILFLSDNNNTKKIEYQMIKNETKKIEEHIGNIEKLRQTMQKH